MISNQISFNFLQLIKKMAEGISKKDKGETSEGSNAFTNEQRAEYFCKLEKWLLEAYVWHSFVATFPYITASSQILHGNYNNIQYYLSILHYKIYIKIRCYTNRNF